MKTATETPTAWAMAAERRPSASWEALWPSATLYSKYVRTSSSSLVPVDANDGTAALASFFLLAREAASSGVMPAS